MTDALVPAATELDLAVAAVVTAAARVEQEQDRSWQPLAEQILAWVDLARSAAVAGPTAVLVKTACTWLKDTGQALREERLAPFAGQSTAIWEQLRQESNVTLGTLKLEGTNRRRRVAVDVTVDGSGVDALGVMSHGELRALGLALFLPRVTAKDSPFRFVVIDDPVQAMDPAKVDGLAGVLASVAKTRQVVVFTHDDRLPESARRLQLGATVLQVTRRGAVGGGAPGRAQPGFALPRRRPSGRQHAGAARGRRRCGGASLCRVPWRRHVTNGSARSTSERGTPTTTSRHCSTGHRPPTS